MKSSPLPHLHPPWLAAHSIGNHSSQVLMMQCKVPTFPLGVWNPASWRSFWKPWMYAFKWRKGTPLNREKRRWTQTLRTLYLLVRGCSFVTREVWTLQIQSSLLSGSKTIVFTVRMRHAHITLSRSCFPGTYVISPPLQCRHLGDIIQLSYLSFPQRILYTVMPDEHLAMKEDKASYLSEKSECFLQIY